MLKFANLMCVTVVTILSLRLLALFLSYYADKNYAKIKFNSFKHFYEINPNRWELYDYCVECVEIGKYYPYIKNKKERFYFTFIDFIKYNYWRSSLHKIELNKSKMESTARMLALVKQDVEKFEAQASAQTNQATDNIRHIVDNMEV